MSVSFNNPNLTDFIQYPYIIWINSIYFFYRALLQRLLASVGLRIFQLHPFQRDNPYPQQEKWSAEYDPWLYLVVSLRGLRF